MRAVCTHHKARRKRPQVEVAKHADELVRGNKTLAFEGTCIDIVCRSSPGRLLDCRCVVHRILQLSCNFQTSKGDSQNSSPSRCHRAEAPAAPSTTSCGLRSVCARRLAPSRLRRCAPPLAPCRLRPVGRSCPPSPATTAPQDARLRSAPAVARRLTHRAQKENSVHSIVQKIPLGNPSVASYSWGHGPQSCIRFRPAPPS